MANQRRRTGQLRVFRPSRNSNCLCGSGRKFKSCCSDSYTLQQPGDGVAEALNQKRHDEALALCRAGITQYTIWFKSHTEPFLVAGAESFQEMLEIDIKALSSLVELLLGCYVEAEKLADLPSALERLRGNVSDHRWSRKITYFQTVAELYATAWDEDAGRRELRKLEPFNEENDVEILQLALHLFGEELSFSEKQTLANRIIKYTHDPVEKLHYRGVIALGYLMIGDESKAELEFVDAVRDYRRVRESENETGYGSNIFATSLQMLGVITSNQGMLDEAAAIYRNLLLDEGWLPLGRASLHQQLGHIHRTKDEWDKAIESYALSSSFFPAAIIQVFESECYLQLGDVAKAISIVNGIDYSLLPDGERIDYALTFAAIAIAGGSKQMLDRAESLLRVIEVKEPFFRERRDSMLVVVLASRLSEKSDADTTNAKNILKTLKHFARRYLILQPNFFGMGVNAGNILNDLGPGSENHSDRES